MHEPTDVPRPFRLWCLVLKILVLGDPSPGVSVGGFFEAGAHAVCVKGVQIHTQNNANSKSNEMAIGIGCSA